MVLIARILTDIKNIRQILQRFYEENRQLMHELAECNLEGRGLLSISFTTIVFTTRALIAIVAEDDEKALNIMEHLQEHL